MTVGKRIISQAGFITVSCDYPECTSFASSYLEGSLDDFSYQDKQFRHELDDKGWTYRTSYADNSAFAYCPAHPLSGADTSPFTVERKRFAEYRGNM